MRVTASEELTAHVADRGGILYVRTRTSWCCSGPLTVLDATTDPPADVDAYRTVPAEGLVVLFRSTVRPDPDELVLTLEGRRRPHPCAYWDGAALII